MEREGAGTLITSPSLLSKGVRPADRTPITRSRGPVLAPPGFPKPVDGATLKISTGSALELDDEVVRMDDVVVIQIEAVVEQVDHRVHRASGRLIRYQVARPVSARVVERE